MQQDFEGNVYWEKFAETCGDISRAAGFRGAARFRGNTVYNLLALNSSYTYILVHGKSDITH